MGIREAIYSRLSGFAGLTALVGTRIYPSRAPQNAVQPFLTYWCTSSIRASAFGADTGDVDGRWQIDAWGVNQTSVQAVAEQVRLALQRWRNAADPVVQDTLIENIFDLDDPAVDTRHAVVICQIFHKE